MHSCTHAAGGFLRQTGAECSFGHVQYATTACPLEYLERQYREALLSDLAMRASRLRGGLPRPSVRDDRGANF